MRVRGGLASYLEVRRRAPELFGSDARLRARAYARESVWRGGASEPAHELSGSSSS